jgi:hypothetical protein
MAKGMNCQPTEALDLFVNQEVNNNLDVLQFQALLF